MNGFEYGIRSGGEMYGMVNEKMGMCKCSILKWLGDGGELLENCEERMKEWVLKGG